MDKEFVKQCEKQLRWLYELRRSGVCNMYEAPDRMVKEFPEIGIELAWEIFDAYCQNFYDIAKYLNIEP